MTVIYTPYTPPPPPANGIITGTVTSAGGAPVSGATVAAGSTTSVTDAAGIYSISIAPGMYTVTASAPGFGMNTTTVTVISGATVTQNFALPPANGTITGTVTNATSGGPIANATVTAGGITAATNAAGIYNIGIAL